MPIPECAVTGVLFVVGRVEPQHSEQTVMDRQGEARGVHHAVSSAFVNDVTVAVLLFCFEFA